MRSRSETEYASRLPSSRRARSCVDAGRAIERARRAAEPPVPAVLAREGAAASRGRTAAMPASARSRSRSVGAASSSPGERGERPADRLPADVVGVEQLAHRLPERARLARRPLVADRLADEHEAPARARARGGEQVPVAARCVRPREARPTPLVERAPCARRPGTARRGVGAGAFPAPARARRRCRSAACGPACRSSTATRPGAPGRARRARSRARAPQRTSARDALEPGRREHFELVEHAADGVVRLQVRPRRRPSGGRRRPVGVAAASRRRARARRRVGAVAPARGRAAAASGRRAARR